MKVQDFGQVNNRVNYLTELTNWETKNISKGNIISLKKKYVEFQEKTDKGQMQLSLNFEVLLNETTPNFSAILHSTDSGANQNNLKRICRRNLRGVEEVAETFIYCLRSGLAS